jgi:hypothetical protein
LLMCRVSIHTFVDVQGHVFVDVYGQIARP